MEWMEAVLVFLNEAILRRCCLRLLCSACLAVCSCGTRKKKMFLALAAVVFIFPAAQQVSTAANRGHGDDKVLFLARQRKDPERVSH